MKSIKFPGCNTEIGKGQPEYNVVHAIHFPGVEGEILACYELTDEEVERIRQDKKLYYTRLTFNQSFQPFKIAVDIDDDQIIDPRLPSIPAAPKDVEELHKTIEMILTGQVKSRFEGRNLDDLVQVAGFLEWVVTGNKTALFTSFLRMIEAGIINEKP